MSDIKKKKKPHQEKTKPVSIRNKKRPLVPADKILHRMKWDATFDINQLIIGYVDRFLGIQEIDMEGFESAEIPMHRIYYLKYNDIVVWDREKKIDLVTGCTDATQLGKQKEEKTESKKQQSSSPPSKQVTGRSRSNSSSSNKRKPVIKLEQQGLDQFEEDQEENEELQEEELIVFNTKKNRKHYKQYEPVDYLESWMVDENVRELALSDPTHISQRGGYYHIPNELQEELLRQWMLSVQSGDEFYMEEYRSQIFRLYVDIDIKNTKKTPYDIVKHGWMPVIVNHTQEFFGNECLPFVVLTECHSEWNDAVTNEAVYKSGYRLYFCGIYVDVKKFKEYITSLTKVLEAKFDNYEGQPNSWKFSNIVDKDVDFHDRARMFGTIKFRRGKNLMRKYSFVGLFGENGKLMENATKALQSDDHLYELLQLTQVRLDKSLIHDIDEKAKVSAENVIRALVFTEKEKRAATIPILLPNWLEKVDLSWFPNMSSKK